MVLRKAFLLHIVALAVLFGGGNSILGDAEQFTQFMEKNEWHELEMDLIVKEMDTTYTSFGKTALNKLLMPIRDQELINTRQTIIRTLVEDEKLYQEINTLLRESTELIDALLSYAPPHDQLIYSSISAYFDFPFVKWLNNKLNNSSIALEWSLGTAIGQQIMAFLRTIFLEEVSVQLFNYALNLNQHIDVKEAFYNAIKQPLTMHSLKVSPAIQQRRTSPQFAGWTLRDMLNATFVGTIGDQALIHSEGYSLGQPPSGAVGIPSFLAYPLAAAIPLYRDFKRFNDMVVTIRSIKSTYTLYQKIHARTVQVAQLFKNIEKLRKCIDQHPSALQTLLPHSLLHPYQQLSPQAKTLITLLHKNTFSAAHKIFYSRGNVLYAHKLIYEQQKEFGPILEGIGELDAYVAVATYYKKCQKNKLPISFATFDTASTLAVHLDEAWHPLLKDFAVTNNYCWNGSAQFPNKWIITGPNGSGKSLALKTIGVNTVLAYAVGIATASSAHFSHLDGLCTSLAPQADITNGLSTYMAAAQSIDRLEKYINTVTEQQMNGLVLIDEPYVGTIESEASKRVMTFLERIALANNCIVNVAVHIKEPVTLAAKYPHLFKNYQVEILAKENNTFYRTFKLIWGWAEWWFEDAAQRARFVDWIGTKAVA